MAKYLAESRHFYLQPPFPGIVYNVFELLGRSVIDPVRSTLAANHGGNLSHDDDTKVQISRESRSSGFLLPSAKRAQASSLLFIHFFLLVLKSASNCSRSGS
jgi:hypothetical protein